MSGLIEAEFLLPASFYSSSLLIDYLNQKGFTSWVEKTKKGETVKIVYQAKEGDRLEHALSYLKKETKLTFSFVRKAELKSENYLHKWFEHFRPLMIGQKLIVIPCLNRQLAGIAQKNKRIAVYIKPGYGFGTGNHPSTYLILEMLEKYLQSGMKVLDVGTGSGILIIAAYKLGAGKATGLDFDRLALENAVENAKINNARFAVFYQRALADFSDFDFDLVLANLSAEEIIANKNRWLNFRPCLLLFSRILKTEVDEIEKEFQHPCFQQIDIKKKKEWVALAYRVI